MKVRYVGPSQHVKSLTNHQIYSVLYVDLPFICIIDDSKESYEYFIVHPGLLDGKMTGRFEIVEDDEKSTLKEAFQAAKIEQETEVPLDPWDELGNTIFYGSAKDVENLKCPECSGPLTVRFEKSESCLTIECQQCGTRSHGDKCLLVPKYLQNEGESNDGRRVEILSM